MSWLLNWRSWFRRKKNSSGSSRTEPSGADKRRSVRYNITLDTSCRLLAMVKGDPTPIRVRNISAGGISLVLNQPPASDSLLDIELLNRPQMFLCPLQVRITFLVEHPTGDCIVGGAFTRQLEEQELKKLLS